MMTINELWTVLEALPWHEVEARKLVADAIEEFYWPDPYARLTKEDKKWVL